MLSLLIKVKGHWSLIKVQATVEILTNVIAKTSK